MAIVQPNTLAMMIQTSSSSVEKLVKPKLMTDVSGCDIYPMVVEVDLFPHHARDSSCRRNSRRRGSSFCYRQYQKQKAPNSVFHSKRIQLHDDGTSTSKTKVEKLQQSLLEIFDGHEHRSKYIMLVRIERSLDAHSCSKRNTLNKNKNHQKRWSWPLSSSNIRKISNQPSSSLSQEDDSSCASELEICYCLFLRKTGDVAYVDRRSYTKNVFPHSIHQEIITASRQHPIVSKVAPSSPLSIPSSKQQQSNQKCTSSSNPAAASLFPSLKQTQVQQQLQQRMSTMMEQKSANIKMAKRTRCDDDEFGSCSFRRVSSRNVEQ